MRPGLHSTIRTLCLLACAFATAILYATPPTPDGTDFFETHIRPLLVEQCYRCHSATSDKIKGGLTLDSKSGMDKGGDNGPILFPGNPDRSRLITAVRWTDPDLQMPPKRKLSDQQIADLAAWVKMGAPDPRVSASNSSTTQPFDLAKARKWWSFQPRAKVQPPTVNNSHWAQTPIDNFILAKLEEKHLSPAKPADKRELIRRATYDLTGLPPTQSEVDAFLADRSPAAYAKVVDRLLASPHYGEKWGRHWLDLVRYTDSFDARAIGSDGDVNNAWRYRDWVVNALNSDLPYNQFVKDQIAGDLMPNTDGTFSNLIATGMYVIGNWPGGDADKDKLMTDIVDDQIDVTGRAFLGVTLACARCHDHKFDPILTSDYYGLAGIFFSSHIMPNPGAKGAGAPVLHIPLLTETQKSERDQYTKQVADLQKQSDAIVAGYRTEAAKASLPKIDGYLQLAWDNRLRDATAVRQAAEQRHLDPVMAEAWAEYLAPRIGSAALQRRPLAYHTDNVQGVAGVESWAFSKDQPLPLAAVNHNKTAVSVGPTIPAQTIIVHPGPNSDVAIGWKSPIAGTIKIHAQVTDADANCGDGIAWKLEVCTNDQAQELAGGAFENGGKSTIDGPQLSAVPVNPGDIVQLIVDPKAEYSCDTTIVQMTITDIAGHSWDLTHDAVTSHLEHWQFFELLARHTNFIPVGSALADWLHQMPSQQSNETARSQVSQKVRDALLAVDVQATALRKAGKDPFAAGAMAGPDAAVYQAIAMPTGSFWQAPKPDGSDLGPAAHQQHEAVRIQLAELQKHPLQPIPMAEAIQDGGTPGTPYSTITDTHIHIRGRYDRLGALVPRHFPVVLAGFNQKPIGEQTHGSGRLQLADWVASPDNPLTARVIANRLWQWHFGQGIVRTPSNFGKLGTPPTHPELLDYLANQLVDHGWSIKAIHRMIMLSAVYQQSSIPDPATFKADPGNLLFGRMNRQRLQAEELRDSLLTATDSLDAKIGGPPDKDADTRRRTLYMMTVRSDRSNYRTLFDAADASAIIDTRVESTVAPQALYLMNNPFVASQAELLAKVAAAQSKMDDRGRIDWLYQRLYCRPAQAREIDIGLHAVADEGWTAYCQILLCANEFTYID
jgi:hypothetical protein